MVVESYVESACIKSSSLSNHQDSACRLLSSPHTHSRLLEEQRTTNKPAGKLSKSISSRSILKQTIHDLDFLENHLLILFLHRRPSRRQFVRTTTSDALIGPPTTSFSINCKFLSLIDRMRSSNYSIPLMNLLFLAAPLLEQSQPRSAQTVQRNPHFHHFLRSFIKSLPNIIFKPKIIITDNYTHPGRES